MHACHHYDNFVVDSKVNGVRKTTKKRAPGVSADNRVLERRTMHRIRARDCGCDRELHSRECRPGLRDRVRRAVGRAPLSEHRSLEPLPGTGYPRAVRASPSVLLGSTWRPVELRVRLSTRTPCLEKSLQVGAFLGQMLTDRLKAPGHCQSQNPIHECAEYGHT